MKYCFIKNNDSNFPVERMCKCMKVSKNGFYTWLRTKGNQKIKQSKAILKERILEIFNDSKQIYGSYRVQQMLSREDLNYSRSYVALLMKDMGLRSVLKRKFVVTTNSNHTNLISENLLNRDFMSLKIGEKWVSDITYVRVGDNWNYLTTIIDLADRKVVGWTLSEDMTTENTIMKTWLIAIKNRSICSGFIFHSDRGVQYASNKITKLLSFNVKASQSMSRKGNCWDNAVAESFFKTIKHEWLLRFKYKNYEELYKSIDEYIIWYNTKRIHSSLEYLTPLEKELQIRKIKNKAA